MPRPRSRRRPRSTTGPRAKARRRRLAGPTDEERREYANQLKHRRLSETFDGGTHMLESVRRGIHYGARPARRGGRVSLLYSWSRKKYTDLVKAGREWRKRRRSQPARPRLVRRRRRLTARSEAVAAHRLTTGGPASADRRMRTLFRHRCGSGTSWPCSSACSSRRPASRAPITTGPVRLRLAFERLGGRG